MIKVSIIMPVFNSNPDYFSQAVESALSQSIEDLELLIIDDGSDDKNFLEHLTETSKIDKRIKVYKKNHQGSGQARNLGISLSNGETISFLDSDDLYSENNTLELLYNSMKENNVLVSGGIPVDLKPDGTQTQPYFNFGNINEYFSDKILDYIDYQFPWWYWSYLYDADLIKKNKFYFPPLLRYQDPIWFVKTMVKAEKFYALNKITYIHRDRGTLKALTKEQIESHIEGICSLLKYSDEEKLTKLHKLLYEVFFDYDINLLKSSEALTEKDIERYSEKINSCTDKTII
ncbi:glycosyltransferase family 2 protein [bacterium]|nr:glycosyltransferase family 2 protein [bacterium]